jgi:TrmH family RNA methyltransferase
LRKPLAWIFGSEGQGVSHIWQERSSGLVRLPINPAVESLNVASAAAVFCFEAVRQRNQWLC